MSDSLPDPLPDPLSALSVLVGARLAARGWMLVTAESCTGGMVAAAITDVAGSSGWFERGYVTYSNDAKMEAIGVPHGLLKRFGAVSEETAGAMADGALAASHAHIALAITGIAGPGGGLPGKPVGTVCFAWALSDGATGAGTGAETITETMHFDGDRAAVRHQSAIHALRGVLARIDNDAT